MKLKFVFGAFALSVFALLFAAPALGAMHHATCHYAVVEWHDAIVFTNASGSVNLNKDQTNHDRAIGCVRIFKGNIQVITNFVGTAADDGKVIPLSWVVNIYPLTGKKSLKFYPAKDGRLKIVSRRPLKASKKLAIRSFNFSFAGQ